MSQKTNPTSLRLQKNSQNFTFPLFADYFWNETYQTCRESQKYITAFLKERSFSEAFFSARMYYRKFPVFIFLQDNRVAKKEKLLFFKKAVLRNIERRSNIKTKFSINDKKIEKKNMLSLKKENSFFLNNLESSKNLKHVKKAFRDDLIRAKQGFFYNLQNTRLSNPLKSNSLLEKRLSKQDLSTQSSRIFNRPCFSLCENVMSSFSQQKTNISIANALFNRNNNHLLQTETSQKWTSKNLKNKPFIDNKLSIENIKNPTKDQQFQSVVSTVKEIEKVTQGKHGIGPHLGFWPYQTDLCENQTNNGFSQKPTNVCFEPIRFIKEHQNVMALADQVIALLEKRISFRQIKSLMFKDLQHYKEIKGIKITCSGRLGGRSKKAQKAKMQSDSYGATTAATFSSKILFASKSAFTSYGKVGIKIWLSFQDKRCT